MLKELLVSISIIATPIPKDIPKGEPRQEYIKQQAICLTNNVYHEARSEGSAGQLAVMAVTLNRVKDTRFPNTVCEVVHEGQHKPSWQDKTRMIPVRNRCQFSWYCDGNPEKIRNQKAWDAIYLLSYEIISGNIKLIDLTDGATHYHANYVSPSWARTKKRTVTIENHIFYRWEK